MYEKVKRECGSCTVCCRGWLTGEAYGNQFYTGRPCHFVGEKGCTIYKERPKSPCEEFYCGWIQDQKNFPEWMKPNLSKILALPAKTKSGIPYYIIFECGEKIDSNILNYLILRTLNNGLNMRIQIGGGWTNYGTYEFLEDLSFVGER